VRLGVRYRYVALDQSPETLTQLKRLAIGRAIHPTVSVGSEMLVEPSLGELDWALLRQGML
jgi:mycoredoxin